MGSHYYDEKPNVAHEHRWIEEELAGVRLRFHTDAGVFSKRGVDFGSRLLIETIQLPSSGNVLDVGCGYGPIGLFVAKTAPNCRVTMVDINERAVALAKENANLNQLEERVTIKQSNLYEAVQEEKFDLIISNPPIRAGKVIVHQIFEQATQLLNPSGSLWIVIQKKQGAPSAWKKLEQLFGQVDDVRRSKGYHIYKATL